MLCSLKTMCVWMYRRLNKTILIFFRREEMNILWWKLFYEALDAFQLHDWWKTTEFYTTNTEG